MNLAINYSKPAVALALKKYVRDKRFIGTYVSALYMCWAQGICKAVMDLPPEVFEDPVIKMAKKVYELRDLDMAKQLYAWFVKCTGQKLYKLTQRIDTGEIKALDLTALLPQPPEWPCPKSL